MLRLDPKNGEYLNNYGISWTIHRFTYDFRHGDFVAAEADLRTGLKYLTGDSASPFLLRNAASAEFALARVLAATGRNEAADEALVRAESLAERSNAELSAGSTAFVLNKTGLSLSRRAVESARLNWAAVRKNAEDALAALAQLRMDAPADRTTLNNQRNAANRDLMTAAFSQGDHRTRQRACPRLGRKCPPDVS